MKKIFFYNILFLIASLNITSIITYELDKEFRQELRNKAEALFGIGNTDVDLRKFSKDSKAARSWNSTMASISKEVSNQAITDIQTLSNSIIEGLNKLKKGLENPVPTNPNDIDAFLTDISKKIETLKNQIKSKSFSELKIDKDTKELINVFVKIFEDIVEKVKNNLIPKMDVLKQDMDRLFGQLDIRNIEKLKNKIDLELDNLNLFVKYSGSTDLPTKFPAYKDALNKITRLIEENNTKWLEASKQAKTDYKAYLESFAKELKATNATIASELKKATDAPDIFVFNTGPKQSKELMLYLAVKYKELAKNFKDQWEKELKENETRAAKTESENKAINISRPSQTPEDIEMQFKNFIELLVKSLDRNVDDGIKYGFETIRKINFIDNQKFDEAKFLKIQNIAQVILGNIRSKFYKVLPSNDYNKKLFDDFSKLSQILGEINKFYMPSNNNEAGLKQAEENNKKTIKEVKTAMEQKKDTLDKDKKTKAIAKAMNNLIGEYEILAQEFVKAAHKFLSSKKS